MPAKVSRILTLIDSYLRSRLGIDHSGSLDCPKKDISHQPHRESHLYIEDAKVVCIGQSLMSSDLWIPK